MTDEEFNKKWARHLEKGHYGMALGTPELIEYVDKKFTEMLEIFPNFTYSQIKEKFGSYRVYIEDTYANNVADYLTIRAFSSTIEKELFEVNRKIRNRKKHDNS